MQTVPLTVDSIAVSFARFPCIDTGSILCLTPTALVLPDAPNRPTRLWGFCVIAI